MQKSILIITLKSPTERCPNHVANGLLRKTNSDGITISGCRRLGRALYVLVEGVTDKIDGAVANMREYAGVTSCEATLPNPVATAA